MKPRLLSLIVLYFAFYLSGYSQTKDFHFRRKINTLDSTKWYGITLPAALFRHVSTAFSDIRIYQLTGQDTLEIPYLLRLNEDIVTREDVALPAFNQSKKGKKLYSTFELPKNQKVNRLDLSFAEPDFNGYVTLEGSTDQHEWFQIEKNQRIASITKDGVQLTATYVNFPLVNYRYLRVSIEADRDLDFPTATFKKLETKNGRAHDIPVSIIRTENKPSKQSILNVHFKDFQRASRIDIIVDNDEDYYRSFQVEQLKDSSKTPKGWEYYYELVYSGLLTSFNQNTFPIEAFTDKLRLTIFNGDNTPLKIKSVSVRGPEIELVAKIKPGTSYLYYGNNAIGAPSYDLEHFTEKVPATASPITLGEEEKLTKESAPTKPLIENKIWLWLVMALIIGVIGFFTLKMMRVK